MKDISLLSVFVSVSSAIIGGMASHYGIPFIHRLKEKKTYYKGFAVDIGNKRGTDFHPPLFKYEFQNALITVSGSTLRLRGGVLTTTITEPKEEIDGEITGSGQILDGKAYINYFGKHPSTNEDWHGVAILNIPNSGPLSGYWMSFHTNKTGGSYALGEIYLEPTGKA